jgi:hypothetical protein
MTPINLHRLIIRVIRLIRGPEVSSFQGATSGRVLNGETVAPTQNSKIIRRNFR